MMDLYFDNNLNHIKELENKRKESAETLEGDIDTKDESESPKEEENCEYVKQNTRGST